MKLDTRHEKHREGPDDEEGGRRGRSRVLRKRRMDTNIQRTAERDAGPSVLVFA